MTYLTTPFEVGKSMGHAEFMTSKRALCPQDIIADGFDAVAEWARGVECGIADARHEPLNPPEEEPGMSLAPDVRTPEEAHAAAIANADAPRYDWGASDDENPAPTLTDVSTLAKVRRNPFQPADAE